MRNGGQVIGGRLFFLMSFGGDRICNSIFILILISAPALMSRPAALRRAESNPAAWYLAQPGYGPHNRSGFACHNTHPWAQWVFLARYQACDLVLSQKALEPLLTACSAALVISCRPAALRMTSDTFEEVLPPFVSSASTHLLGQLLFGLLVPCWLTTTVWRAAQAAPWAPFLFVSAVTAASSLTGALVGSTCGTTVVSLWRFILEKRACLYTASQPSDDAPRSSRASGAGLPLPAWLKLPRWRPLFSLPQTEESAMAGAVAKALGIPQAAQALLPSQPQPPPWLPAVLMCVGAAAGSAAASGLTPHMLIESQQLITHLAPTLHHITSNYLPAWLAQPAGVLASTASSAITAGQGSWWWSQHAITIGQAVAMWAVLLPAVQHHVRSSSVGSSGLPNLSTPRIPGWFKSMQWRSQQAGAATQSQGRRPAGTGSEPGIPDLPQGRVWVRLGDNQEVLLSPRDLAQLVPFNTPLAGTLRVSEQQGSAGQVGPEGGEEGEVVPAEVTDYTPPPPPQARDGGSTDGGDNGGWIRQLREVWQRACTWGWEAVTAHPPLAGLLIGCLVSAAATRSPGYPAAHQRHHISSEPAAAVLVGHAAQPLSDDLVKASMPPAVQAYHELHRNPMQLQSSQRSESVSHPAGQLHESEHRPGTLSAVTVAPELDLDPSEMQHIESSSDDEGGLVATANPWDWRVLKAVLNCAAACCVWASGATPHVLCLFAACAAASASMRKRSWVGAQEGDPTSSPAGSSEGAGAASDATPGRGWDLLQGWQFETDAWKPTGGLSGGGPLALSCLLLIPNNLIDLVLLVSAALTALLAVPAALALMAAFITWAVNPIDLPSTTVFWPVFKQGWCQIWHHCANKPAAALYLLLMHAALPPLDIDGRVQGMSTALRVQMMNSMALLMMRVALLGAGVCWLATV